jgi:hypothetical protein
MVQSQNVSPRDVRMASCGSLMNRVNKFKDFVDIVGR